MYDNVLSIDGPAAAGKSTVAEKVAKRLNAFYVNTGNMYRAVTLHAIKNGFRDGINPCDFIVPLLSQLQLEYKFSKNGNSVLIMNKVPIDSSIRSHEVSRLVSAVSAVPEVRKWLIERQRRFSKKEIIVMEGRDIGTVVFPNAKYKFFLTASPEVRAKRRLEQNGEIPDGASISEVATEIAKRDEMDMKRIVAPLRKADDAILIDCSEMNAEQVTDFIINHVKTH